MKRILLALGIFGLLLGLPSAPASAQVACTGVGGVNNVPQTGINCNQEPLIATFAAMGYGIVPAASATDVACITGSATRVVRVQRIVVGGTAGTAVVLPVLVNKHTIANTGGTAATTTALPVPMKMDTSAAAATATTTAYTANPTVDASATQLTAENLSLTTTSSAAGALVGTVFTWIDRSYMSAPVLRGVAQQVCVNFGGISVSSGLVSVSFEWTEAPL